MNRELRRKIRRMAGKEPWLAQDGLADELTDINLYLVDEARPVIRPDGVGGLYVEQEFDARSEEQPELWQARGEAAAREFSTHAAGLKGEAADLEQLTVRQLLLEEQSMQELILFRRVLLKYTRRSKGERPLYWIRMPALLGGDVAGVAGSAIWLGEDPKLALLQAIASGVAAITAGAAAAEVKDARLARKRQKDPDKLTREEKAFAHLFKGPDRGEFIVKLVVCGSLCIGALIGGAVFALRSTTEGATAGVMFGLLAVAITLASWVSTYAYTDEVADLIETAERKHKRDRKDARELSGSKVRRTFAEATATAESVKVEFLKVGKAAAHAMKACKFVVLRNNPGVAGHGYAASERRSSRRYPPYEPESTVPSRNGDGNKDESLR